MLLALLADEEVGMAEKPIRVFACECQPIVVEGLRRVLESSLEFQLAGAAAAPGQVLQEVVSLCPDVILVSQEAGTYPDGRFAGELRLAFPHSRLVLWLTDLEGEESLLGLGFQGLIQKRHPIPMLLECLRAVGRGGLWVEGPASVQGLRFEKRKDPPRLTPREREIARLVASGMKNREIAKTLSISPGTVKVHLMHVFEKAGVQNRSQLTVQARWLDLDPGGRRESLQDGTDPKPE